MLQKILPNNVSVRKHAKALFLFNTLLCNDESHRFKEYEVSQKILDNNVTVRKYAKAMLLFNTLSCNDDLTGSKDTKRYRKYSWIM